MNRMIINNLDNKGVKDILNKTCNELNNLIKIISELNTEDTKKYILVQQIAKVEFMMHHIKLIECIKDETIDDEVDILFDNLNK